MHAYTMADGRVMYFPTHESDIELQKAGDLTVSDFLKLASQRDCFRREKNGGTSWNNKWV